MALNASSFETGCQHTEHRMWCVACRVVCQGHPHHQQAWVVQVQGVLDLQAALAQHLDPCPWGHPQAGHLQVSACEVKQRLCAVARLLQFSVAVIGWLFSSAMRFYQQWLGQWRH